MNALTWQQQVEMLLKTANRAERERIIQHIKEKAALPARTDKAVKEKIINLTFNYTIKIIIRKGVK